MLWRAPFKDTQGGPDMLRQVATLVTLCLLACCASNPKARIVTAYQSVELGLGALQDAERAAYASGAIPALTRAVHEQRVSPAFAQVFDMQVRVGNALLAWQPGAAPPVGYEQWVASIENVAAVLRAVAPRDSAVFDATLAFVRAAVDAIRRFGQPPSLALLALATPQ
jgi:hypothetical protein